MEIWKDIKGYEGLYQVSNLGRVKSLARKVKGRSIAIVPLKERILKAGFTKDGYKTVAVSISKVVRRVSYVK